ncbi:MAG: lipoprotein-releasing ABC transporter ATP-binding protein LolD [bacterium]|nr:lipoprotein-releasing ABC transporter ATP-binding protein LolD [Gammaproteobacteria bacterium]HIL95090.1 lipoprotein-releasing ABC transporter ATP-binding protein LolD [Pseudomonadales bacterium]
MSNVVIAVTDLHKYYQQGSNRLHVLRGLNLEVVRGERVAIIGISGSGKSTLLHLLGGLDTPNEGSVFVQGQDVHRMNEKGLCQLRNRSLGFVYQFHHLLAEFTALENTAMPLLIRGESRSSAMASAKEILDKVGLANRTEHKPNQLSGGERQRVAIARALVTRPDCVLADEPTGNLDEETASQVDDLMISLSKEFETSFVIVTHNLALASQMDRICRLHNGQIEA